MSQVSVAAAAAAVAGILRNHRRRQLLISKTKTSYLLPAMMNGPITTTIQLLPACNCTARDDKDDIHIYI